MIRGMGTGLGGVEVVMSMEEIPQGALGNLGNLTSGNLAALTSITATSGQPDQVDGGGTFVLFPVPMAKLTILIMSVQYSATAF